jgi:cyclomaltodextrinase
MHLPDKPLAYGIGPSTLRVVLRTPTGSVSGGEVRFNDRYAWEGTDYAPLRLQAPLKRYALDGDIEYWAADLELRPPRLRYRFGLDTAEGRRWFGWDGLRDAPSPRGSFEFAYIAEGDLPDSPDWARGATFYQIFPERFARGSAGHRRGPVSDWDGPVDRDTFLGGDLDGIVERLDHIASLSVDALYLTPIFSSPSNHKYDTSDYFSVDPDFGGNAALRRLVTAAGDRGIRIVLDGVFNHVGASWPPFVDALRNGADSPYARWFYFDRPKASGQPKKRGLGYETWSTNVASMPKLRTSDAEVRELVCRVGRFWVQEFGIDGWRLDVANEVDHALWRSFRTSVRAGNGEAFLFGEIWDWAMPWLRGDQFDSTMNYPLRQAILDFAGSAESAGMAAKADGARLLDRIDRLRAAYPEPIHDLLYNLLGSHDEDRPLTTVGGSHDRFALAVGLLFALPGAVSTYYGDEVGMVGAREDHSNRRGMVWKPDLQNGRLLELHRMLGKLRRKSPALRVGAYERLTGAGPLAVFARGSGAERVVVLANGDDGALKVADRDLNDWVGGRARIVETVSYRDERPSGLGGSLRFPAHSVTFVARAT